jgi:hypothetical protein
MILIGYDVDWASVQSIEISIRRRTGTSDMQVVTEAGMRIGRSCSRKVREQCGSLVKDEVGDK